MFGRGKNIKKLKETKVHKYRIKNVSTKSHQPKIALKLEMLHENIFFIDTASNKYASIGYSVTENCRPIISLFDGTGTINLLLTDWLAIFVFNTQIETWLAQNTENQQPTESWRVSNNITLNKIISNNKSFIQIASTDQQKPDKKICLNDSEFRKCCELDSYFQYLMKEMQKNFIFIDEYYNMYIYYCILNNKQNLSDEEYFTTDNFPISIDSFKIFKEIPIKCGRNLQKDLNK